MGWLQGKHGVGDLGDVGPRAADALVRGGAVVLDVRERAEGQAGRVADAFRILLGQAEGRRSAPPRDRRVVVTCRSAKRSAAARSLLVRSGFDAARFGGGIQPWSPAGLPKETGAAQPGTVA